MLRNTEKNKLQAHHFNGNMLDNNPDNITLATDDEHKRLDGERFKIYGVPNTAQLVYEHLKEYGFTYSI
jgi:hypothetical protein